MKKTCFIVILNFCFFTCVCQTKIYPTHWWAQMKNPELQIMMHGKNIGNADAYTINYPGVKLVKVNKVENPDYVFLDLVISSSAKPGRFTVNVQASENLKIKYELKPRRSGKSVSYAKGVYSNDLLYLIMPDRFSNGDTSNDRVPGMRDQSLNRDSIYDRHGGDLKGIENHLDYLQSIGVTALWLNPVIENDMPSRTEHGYAFTDHYRIDPRLGGEAAYRSLIDKVHQRGMKIIQDAVYNHVGSYHFTVIDPPMKDWLHQWPAYTQTNYKDQLLFDPYASAKEKKVMSDGWFVTSMPDMNQSNPFVEKFLIQHALWTVEEFGIDGWRIDTYAYNDLAFMNRCNKALMEEYPRLTMFGETWVHGVVNQSYFVQNNFDIPYKSNLQAPTDFQTLWAITATMTKDFGWNEGVNTMYTTLAQDFVYKDPMRNVIFLDNHDISRFFSVIGENVNKYKAALAWLFTYRGVPQIYYGAEIGMTGLAFPYDGFVREDFIGGWANDTINKFLPTGRNEREDSIFNYLSVLANFRKHSSAIGFGKMMQFAPKDGEYVFFRYNDKQTIMTAMNTAKKPLVITMKNYEERTKGFSKMKHVITGEVTPLKDFTLQPDDSGVWELVK